MGGYSVSSSLRIIAITLNGFQQASAAIAHSLIKPSSQRELGFIAFRSSQKIRMILNGLFDPLWLNADVTLRGGGTAVLQKPLNKGDVIAIGLVDLRCVPFAKTVGADALVTQIVADYPQLFLNCSFCNWENGFRFGDAVSQTVIFDVLLNDKGNCKHSAFACLLLHHFQSEAISITNDVAEPKVQNVADTQAQVSFQHQDRGDPLIGAAAAKTLSHGLNDFLVLLCGQSLCFLVHGCLQ